MTTIRAGSVPESLVVTVSAKSDFTDTRVLEDAAGNPVDFPAGTTLAYEVDGLDPWVATISGSVASWTVDVAVASGVPHLTPVRLTYSNGTTQRLLASGVVNYRD